MTQLHWPALITLLTMVLLFAVSFQVGRARGIYKIPAPATTGNPDFERIFRVQMNTNESVLMFLPALWLFAIYTSATWAGVLGAIWLAGRIWYAIGYTSAANKRGGGFGVSAGVALILIIGAIIGVVMRMQGGA
jgi:glutathione S-transferase